METETVPIIMETPEPVTKPVKKLFNSYEYFAIFVFCVILLQKQISLGQHAMCFAEFPRPETCACFDRRF